MGRCNGKHSWSHSTPQAFAAYLLAWAKSDFHADVVGSSVPIKVIVGEHDQAILPDVIKDTFLQWYKNAELDVMPNAGHYPMDETPVALMMSIEAFLRR